MLNTPHRRNSDMISIRIEYILGIVTLLWAAAIATYPPIHFTNVQLWMMASVVVGSAQIIIARNPHLIRTTAHFCSALMGATLWSFIAWNAKTAGAEAEIVLLYCFVSSLSLWDLIRA